MQTFNEKNLSIVKAHWENKDTVSLKDENLRELEQDVIIEYLKLINQKSLNDFGCGDAGDTVRFSKYVNNINAYDYSKSMLSKASKNIKNQENIVLSELDIINDQITTKADIALTKRLLINLGNFENQKNVIKKIYNSIEKNGYFIMLETSLDGLNNLNYLRKKTKLPEIPAPHHNTLFDLEDLKKYLQELFILEDVRYFSTYYFFTRIYNQMLENTDMKKYDVLAKKITGLGLNFFEDKIIGPQFAMLLRKK